ncbi:hypothetical protein QWI17_17190 [Gilvimarinus sp. SDUM040013]|uniref:Lipoprotein n=1 Tax=Gilvimarinus gilvus TaxID=3058038 RepID=A0ABU4RZ28_9GAMM|nr:hypothetical protein [Gilvimarinus sp. SDUM040013]MDO3387581.1 hypothetical protein [Gilvimarinus sp. SDUM040013]MDX6850154.1 hypothetical protein [Gilvimarinus sp. SDUM040013]
MKPRDFAVWVSMALLASACGAERDEPFDPGTGVDDEDETIESITIRRVISGEQTLLDIDGQKQLLVLRSEEDYFLFLDRYTDQLLAFEPDFEAGQVALIDLGARDDNNCDYTLRLQTVSAQVLDDDTAQLNVKYGSNALDTSEACPESDPDTVRPFYFYYVESRSQLVIAETIDD